MFSLNEVLFLTDINICSALFSLSSYFSLSHLFSFQSDSQVYKACCSFVDNNAEEIVKKNLKRNLILHLVNLNDFDLINGGQIQHIITKFLERISQTTQPTTSEWNCSLFLDFLVEVQNFFDFPYYQSILYLCK